MRNKHLLLISLFFILSIRIIQSQNIPINPNKIDKNNLKQGFWTITYDKDWQKTDDDTKVAFYRVVLYKDNKIIGKVRNYYKNQQIQMEADSLVSENPDLFEGKVSFYRTNGNKEKTLIYKDEKLMKAHFFDKGGKKIKAGWRSLDRKGRRLKKQGKYKESSRYREKAKIQIEIQFGKQHTHYATVCNNLALSYQEQGLYAKAEPLYIEAKNIREKILGKNHPYYANSCNNLGTLYYRQGLYVKAELLYIEAKNIREKILGKNHLAYATSCNNLGTLYYRQGLYAKAELLYIEAKNIQEKILGRNHHSYATSCYSLGVLYYRQGLYVRAEPLYIEAKNIQEKILGKNHPSYATSCIGLGSLYNTQGLYTKAEPLYIEAKDIYEKALGKNHPKYATSCYSLGILYYTQGLYAKAEPLYIEAKNIRKKILGRNHPSYANSCNNVASVYHAQGLYIKAEPLYIEAKSIQEKILGKNHPSYANSCNNLADLYAKQGLYAQAEPLYIEAKNIRKKILGKNHSDYTTSCNSLGSLYYMQGLYAKAEPLYIEAKNIREKILGRNHPSYANSCNNLGSLYSRQGLYSKAEPFLLEAKNIQEKILGRNHPNYATSCNNMALLYYQQDLYAKATPLFLEAKNIREKILGRNHPDYANSCNNLANLYSKQGLYAKAAPLYIEAKDIQEKILGRNHPSYAHILSSLVAMYQVQGLNKLAQSNFTELFQNLQIQTKNNFPYLSEKNRNLFFQTQILGNFQVYNSFIFKTNKQKDLRGSILAQMYQNHLFIKSLLFNSSQKIKERILTSGDSLLVENYQNYLAKLKRYNKTLEMPIAEREKKGISIDNLYLEVQELEKQISRQSTAFAQNLEEYEVHTWQEVQATLQKNEVAIEIIRFNWYDKKWTDTVYYAALIVSPETQDYPELVILENGNDLESKYSKNYYQNIDNKKQDGESYIQFWQPIEDKLKEIKAFRNQENPRIYISLDGAYYQINLNTLKNPTTGKYLEEDYDIQIVSNTKDLLKPASQFSWETAEKDSVELFGYPLYNTFPEKQEVIDDQDELDYLLSLKASNRGITDSTRSNTWNILFGTKKEVNQIEKILHSKYKVAKHIRTAANETALKNLFSPPILHIATHGYFLADIPQDTTNRQMAGTSTYDLRKNPLLRSGLILAGANNTWQGNPPKVGDNGILTAQEAKELNLDHTQLVVLSACETGKGKIQNGEGIFGLQRAFLSAGSDFVLNSLWKVDDEATQILMTYFYKHLLRYADIRKALKKARQDLRKYEGGKFDSPKYWGAFILVGR